MAMNTEEAAKYLRTRQVGHRAGSRVAYVDVDLGKLREIAVLLENCYGCGRCFNTLKQKQTANVCDAAHHAGCGCDLDFTTGLPPDDITHYQLDAQKGTVLPIIMTHAFVPRYRAGFLCGWTEADGMTCGYPSGSHSAVFDEQAPAPSDQRED